MSDEPLADARDGFDLRRARENYDAFVARAREHHARTGEWPPDPLLDEIDEIRREIMAEHDNDWRKVLRWHVEQDKLFAEQNPNARFASKRNQATGVSGL
ncbi:MAG TPA: hypothetical protein VGC13_13795 [Longimicrobium sp.]|jgi:hypothetical protein|uniref:hypothetical protein n=1 Tax=Longimicrobium sp. TaxID=2029185 RepID=UPI002EDB9202